MDRNANRLALKKETSKATYTQTKEGLICVDSIGRESLYPNSLLIKRNDRVYAIIGKDAGGSVRLKSIETGVIKKLNKIEFQRWKQ